jgi:hypothetical protein
MKNIALVLLAIVLVSSIAVSGDMAKTGQWGVNSALGFSTVGPVGVQAVGFKFMATDNVAIRAGVGFSSFSPAGGGGSSSGYLFGAGFEYHMTAVGGVSPYLGIQAGYAGASIANNTGSNPTAFTVNGVYGGEYFFSSNFSLAGEVGIGYTSQGVSGAMNSTFGTGAANFIATWYLN